MWKPKKDIEFQIKDTYIKYYFWLKKQIIAELSNYKIITIKVMNYLLKKNDYLHLLCLHLYNIKKVIFQDKEISFDSFIYDYINCENSLPHDILSINIEPKNYNVILELLNHKKNSSFECCYKKEYHILDKLEEIKLKIN
jgi:hypothetical protein